jgi:aminoglycoside 6'-N-acetyltransferase I
VNKWVDCSTNHQVFDGGVFMKVLRLQPKDTDYISQVANLLVEGFKDTGSTSWPNLEAGLSEVNESLQDDRISLVAVDNNEKVIGWVSGIRKYDGYTWELHGLIIQQTYRRQGNGKILVTALEEHLRKLGCTTIYLGTDDENFRTTISGKDLYPNVLENLLNIRNPGNHPYEFYQRVGFTIVGIIPDANGLGKPDILMAKRVKGLQ